MLEIVEGDSVGQSIFGSVTLFNSLDLLDHGQTGNHAKDKGHF